VGANAAASGVLCQSVCTCGVHARGGPGRASGQRRWWPL